MTEHQYPQWACGVCRDTKVIWSPDLDGESMYESACPNPIHDEMERAARQIAEDLRGDLEDWRAEWVSQDRGRYLGVSEPFEETAP